MLRLMCKSKIHRATVTEANLFYAGSLTIDKALMSQADILPHEKVQVANITNGQRFETYAIEGEEGSGNICLNGAAARLANVGDLILIITYAYMEDLEAKEHCPRIVHVDQKNAVTKIDSGLPEPIRF